MAKSNRSPIISSEFAVLDVKKGRGQLLKTVQGGAAVPVKIEGVIDGVWGSDDGESNEFSLRITKITPTARVQPFATVANTKAGDVLIADGGFTCLKDGVARKVFTDKDGHLFVRCKEGQHGLAGQVSLNNKWYVGFYKHWTTPNRPRRAEKC